MFVEFGGEPTVAEAVDVNEVVHGGPSVLSFPKKTDRCLNLKWTRSMSPSQEVNHEKFNWKWQVSTFLFSTWYYYDEDTDILYLIVYKCIIQEAG